MNKWKLRRPLSKASLWILIGFISLGPDIQRTLGKVTEKLGGHVQFIKWWHKTECYVCVCGGINAWLPSLWHSSHGDVGLYLYSSYLSKHRTSSPNRIQLHDFWGKESYAAPSMLSRKHAFGRLSPHMSLFSGPDGTDAKGPRRGNCEWTYLGPHRPALCQLNIGEWLSLMS